MIPSGFLKTNVSRETEDRLAEFASLVQKWNKKINLVSKQDAENVWERHILDSLQILDLVEFPEKWLDLGSGGGFPAIVLAIVARNCAPQTHFNLIESDKRKCAFLLTAKTTLDLNVSVFPQRIENAPPQGADVISARALTVLQDLFDISHKHCKPTTTYIFPKGKSHAQEISEARQHWSFMCDEIPSKTNAEAAVLKIWGLKRGSSST